MLPKNLVYMLERLGYLEKRLHSTKRSIFYLVSHHSLSPLAQSYIKKEIRTPKKKDPKGEGKKGLMEKLELNCLDKVQKGI